MYLHEYQSKPYFARFGIPTPEGRIATSHQSARAIATEFGSAVVLNAQALGNQRIFRLAQTPDEAEHIARDLLAMTIQGVHVHTILIEPAVDVAAEFFVGIYADRGSTWVIYGLAAASHELSDLEHLRPQTQIRETINPFLGVLEFQARNLASGLNLPRESWNEFTQIAQNLYRCCLACDAVRAELNPFALTRSGKLIALGGRLVIDDNALSRQPELVAIRDVQAEHESVVQARSAGVSYVHLNGDVGLVVSGAGLGMATMDLLARHAGGTSSLLDLGSDVDRDKIVAALHLLLPDARALLFNIFADKARCDEVALELLAAFDQVQIGIPVVIRLAGLNADQGGSMLRAANRVCAATTTEAVHLIAAAAKGITDVNSGG